MDAPYVACPPITPVDDHIEPIYILHPVSGICFLEFGCRDRVEENGGTVFTINFSFLIHALRVVTMSDGFFSTSDDRDDDENATVSATSVRLKSGSYFFHVSDGANPDYAVCDDFRAWIPPASWADLPGPWKALPRANIGFMEPTSTTWTSISSWVKVGKACVLSGWIQPLDAARLIPREHEDWVDHFNIFNKLPIPRSIPRNLTKGNKASDIRNVIVLEQSLQTETDGHLFTFFPTSSSIVCAYFAAPEPVTAATIYHLAQSNLPARIDPFFLYCRFAWNVIGWVMPTKVRAYSIPMELQHNKGRKRPRVADSGGDPGSPAAGDDVAGASDGGSADHSESQSGKKENVENMEWETYEKKYLGPQVGSFEEIAEMEKTIDSETRRMFEDEEASDDEAKPLKHCSSLFTDLYYAYPGMTEIARLKLKYIQEHKSVTETGEETTVRKDDGLRKGLLLLN
ncbi:hypothetical protein FISHEDRAFT_76501 [Fistulina hepatica ATCC 64428]|uniref:HNH nuclease domain-containing protein n=1 Tax=Fistulina hepatica ATCC 64428 TaxID=1128425 RepID=A0A0D7A5J9_9AGAR|nr:hypothetical protein FISHEDRAFT_76501 [Fistulina hepatica ATCC 64428]